VNPRYSVIVPAYNEEQRVEATLADYGRVFWDSEIIVVCNGCVDRTRPKVEQLQREFPNVHCIEIPHAVGKGGAVRVGFLHARAPFVGFVDADGATPARELRRLFESLGTNDGIIGSRWLPGARVFNAQPFSRRFASRVFNSLVRACFGLRFADTQCGAKVFRAEALQRVITHVETSNMAFDADLLLALKTASLKIVEEPTEWRDVKGSSVRLLPTSAKMLAALVRLRLQRSFFRIAIPLFDRLFPTQPIRTHDGLRILILNWRDPLHPQAGGAEAYLHEMAKHWIARGNSVEWLTASFKGAAREANFDGIKIRRTGNRWTVYAFVPFVYWKHFRDRFDIVIDSENGIPFFSPVFSMKPKICVMHHVHQRVFRTHLPFPASSLAAWLEGRLMPRVYKNTQFVAVSEDTRTEMDAYRLSALPVEVVHNGVDPDLTAGPKSSDPLVVYLGRLKPYKRLDRLIESFERVAKSVPNARLVIAGAGSDERRLRRLAAQAGLLERITFEGFVDHKRKCELLQQAWVFVHPSSMEGWGISVIEANACGTPAIAYRVPGLREAIKDGETGLLLDDGEDLARPIVRVLLDEPLRAQLRSSAIRHSAAFSWQASADRFFEIMIGAVVGNAYGFVRRNGRWMIFEGKRNGATASASAATATRIDAVREA
jgi:glycosyltransferase involved in cell wall biosynthesis